MYRIIEKNVLVPNIVFMKIKAPGVARTARPGQFIILRVDDTGERFPLSLAGWDSNDGTVEIVFFIVGTSTMKLASLRKGDQILNLAGPLGIPTPIENYGRVICACGCFGVGPAIPLANALREAGNQVTVIVEARNRKFLFWEDRLKKVSDIFYVASGSGSCGAKSWANDLISKLLSRGDKIDHIFAQGCPFMMMKCSEASKPYGIKTTVSLTPVMVDGTGMCGACRVEVGGETKFACVDGPEFDGHMVNWDLLIMSQRRFIREEYLSLNLWERENWHKIIGMEQYGRGKEEEKGQSESCFHAKTATRNTKV